MTSSYDTRSDDNYWNDNDNYSDDDWEDEETENAVIPSELDQSAVTIPYDARGTDSVGLEQGHANHEANIEVTPSELDRSAVTIPYDALGSDMVLLDYNIPVREFLEDQKNAYHVAIQLHRHIFILDTSVVRKLYRDGKRYECYEANTACPENINRRPAETLFNLKVTGVPLDGYVYFSEIKAVVETRPSRYYTLVATHKEVVSVVSADYADHRGMIVSSSHCQSGQGGQVYRIMVATLGPRIPRTSNDIGFKLTNQNIKFHVHKYIFYIEKKKREPQFEPNMNILPIGEWDVSNVTDMSMLFHGCDTFNEDINLWKVDNVNNMSGMFSGCKSFNQRIDYWNVSKVTDMSFMFYGCTAFKSLIPKWDVRQVIDMKYMFFRCTSFNGHIGNWKVHNVTNMKKMFCQCSVFDQDIGDWNVSNVLDMKLMFYKCHCFNQDISRWDVGRVVSETSRSFRNIFIECPIEDQHKPERFRTIDAYQAHTNFGDETSTVGGRRRRRRRKTHRKAVFTSRKTKSKLKSYVRLTRKRRPWSKSPTRKSRVKLTKTNT